MFQYCIQEIKTTVIIISREKEKEWTCALWILVKKKISSSCSSVELRKLKLDRLKEKDEKERIGKELIFEDISPLTGHDKLSHPLVLLENMSSFYPSVEISIRWQLRVTKKI